MDLGTEGLRPVSIWQANSGPGWWKTDALATKAQAEAAQREIVKVLDNRAADGDSWERMTRDIIVNAGDNQLVRWYFVKGRQVSITVKRNAMMKLFELMQKDATGGDVEIEEVTIENAKGVLVKIFHDDQRDPWWEKYLVIGDGAVKL